MRDEGGGESSKERRGGRGEKCRMEKWGVMSSEFGERIVLTWIRRIVTGFP